MKPRLGRTDRPFFPDGGECLVRRHLAGGDKAGYHHRCAPADTHEAMTHFVVL